jgi:cellulose synthase/poly-beta-1,6-N-acetylglucosamine synthase-like glycosyltransferase
MTEGKHQAALARTTAELTVSVIMPVYNAVQYITRSLPPLLDMQQRGVVLEVIVVDDASSDNTPDVATGMGAQVILSGGRLGPGGARNRGAAAASGDILWFVDADVVAANDAVQVLAAGLAEPGVVAAFGAYDDRPPAQNFLSQYKNLVHHYFHSRAGGEASTFWSGCGVVLKDAFMRVGGFNADMHCVEDIDLGYRLRDAGGRILLLPAAHGTHLKEWHLLNLLCTEIFCRALPWSRLILTRTGRQDELNITSGERLRAGLAGLLVITLLCAPPGLAPWWVPAAMAVAVAIANRQLFRFFSQRKGPAFALGATLFHQFYYLYSSAAFVWSWIEVRIFRQHRKPAA